MDTTAKLWDLQSGTEIATLTVRFYFFTLALRVYSYS